MLLSKASRRHALVVYSQCASMPQLPQLADAALRLDAVLRDPQLGACRPALSSESLVGDGLNGELGRETVIRSVEDAIQLAGRHEAQLILAFLGHGFSAGGSGVYFMCTNSEPGNPLSAVRLDQLLETAANMPNIDGVLGIVDTCFAGGAGPSTAELANGIRGGRTRVAVFMSSMISESSYNMRFTSELVKQLTSGVEGAGPMLYPTTLHTVLSEQLIGQNPTLTAYLAGQPIHPESVGLPVGKNRVTDNSWGGTLEVEWVRELTATYCETPSRLAIQNALAGSRLVHLRGSSGSGKSTLLADMTRTGFGGRELDALVFCDERQTLASLSERISAQLAVTLRGNFQQSFLSARDRARKEADETADAWQVKLVQPLSRLIGVRACIGLDAVDQLDAGVRKQLYDTVDWTLERTPSGVKFLIASREDDCLPGNHTPIIVRPNRLDPETVGYWLNQLGEPEHVRAHLAEREWGADNDWLFARLLLDLHRDGLSEGDSLSDLAAIFDFVHSLAAQGQADEIAFVEAILVAVGPGSVPLTIVKEASTFAGLDLTTPQIRDLLAQLRHTVIRIHPGTPYETVRVLHSSYLEYLGGHITGERLRQAHSWVLQALKGHDLLTPSETTSPESQTLLAYGLGSRPRHAMGSCQFDQLVEAIEQLHAVRRLFAADRRDDWRRWTELVDAAGSDVGPQCSELKLELRWKTARWTGEAGNTSAAYKAFTELLLQARELYGDDHEFTLSTRHQLARYMARTGDGSRATEAFEVLLHDRERIQGAKHPETLETALDLARWLGYRGHHEKATVMVQELLPRIRAVQPPQHRLLLRARGFLARWRGDSGKSGMAQAELRDLQKETESLFGRYHPDTLDFRHSVAWWTGRAGDAPAAVRMLDDLVQDSVRVLGKTNKDTLIRRRDLARWRGDAGDPAGAVALLTDVVNQLTSSTDQRDYDLLDARHSLAWWTGRTGDRLGAIRLFEVLLQDCIDVLRAGDPHSLLVRRDLAQLHGEAGDAPRAAAQLEQLTIDMEQCPRLRTADAFNIRHTRAWWTGQAGNSVLAVRILTELASDRSRVRGADDRDCLLTRRDVAFWMTRSGNTGAAITELTGLVEDMERVFGEDATETMHCRNLLVETQAAQLSTAGGA